MKAYQFVSNMSNQAEALQAYEAWASQDGFLGGAVHYRANGQGQYSWVLAVYFECPNQDLPYGPTNLDDTRVVELIPNCMKTFERFHKDLMASKVFEYTTAPVPVEESEEMLAQCAEIEGFLGANIETDGVTSVVKAYYPADPSLRFGTYRPGWIVTLMPSECRTPRVATIRRPAGGDWNAYLESISCPHLRAAVAHHLNTWYPDIADQFEVNYLG